MDHIAFECDDVGTAYRQLLEGGARSGHPPFAEGRSILAYVQDPDGIWIELYASAPTDGGRRASEPRTIRASTAR